ncbi:MAG: FAD-dependent oxidoreductase [Terrimicrobiaceae bacterium]
MNSCQISHESCVNRRQFIDQMGGTALILLGGGSPLIAGADDKPVGQRDARTGEFVFLEAEQFADLGGWDLDQQSMDQMGSAYLLAHGLGVPVRDAVTQVTFPSAGSYRVWVRTRDWVAPWNAPGAPGKFQLLVDGKPLEEVFGTKSATWHWHDGGKVTVGAQATLALHDLTGFEGRCEAVLFCKDMDFTPVNDVEALTKFRRALLGLPDQPDDGGSFDLVVVGGGVAGCSTAVSAARNGLRVALLQDRPVLGGNCSSEVRVWPEGHTRQKPYEHIGEIVEEMMPAVKHPGSNNSLGAAHYDDARKMDVVRAEPRITLMLGQRVQGVEMDAGRIAAVVAQHTITARRVRVRGKIFADCSGDATVGFHAGADFEIHEGQNMGMSNLWNLMDASDKEQVLKCECKDKAALSSAFEAGAVAAPFPRCPWAVDLSDKPFPGRSPGKTGAPSKALGDWSWESGYERDVVSEVERIRDQNLRAMYGAWDALKNVDKLYPNYRLGWAAFIAGKRESRRLMGDVILTDQDFLKGVAYPDPAFPCSWGVDLHVPAKKFKAGHEGEEFISEATVCEADKAKFHYKGPYWAPYRCLYSRNVPNLFMAGRNISVTHDGLGPVRVMRTCGMMGEVVGKAAAICVNKSTSPRGVYEQYLPLLREMMQQPGATRRS